MKKVNYLKRFSIEEGGRILAAFETWQEVSSFLMAYYGSLRTFSIWDHETRQELFTTIKL